MVHQDSIIGVALIGLLTGWLVTWSVDYLPRFSTGHSAIPVTPIRLSSPGLWQLLNSIRQGDSWAAAEKKLSAGVELLSSLFFAGAWMRLGMSGNFVLLTGSYIFLLLLSLIDIKYRLVLNVLVYPAIAFTFITHTLISQEKILNILLGGILAFSVFALTAWLRPGELGGGDIKLATLIGFALGFPNVLGALLLGAGIGALATIFLLAFRRRSLKDRIPYAPFLCLGAFIMLLYVIFVS